MLAFVFILGMDRHLTGGQRGRNLDDVGGAGKTNIHDPDVPPGALAFFSPECYDTSVNSPGNAIDIRFERIELADLPEALELALANTDVRIGSYALEPPGAIRRARFKAFLAMAPGIGSRVARPDRSFWIVSKGQRNGVLLLDENGSWIHLHFVVLARALQGSGAADRTLAFVEEQARAAGAKGIDLYVDRRNHRAYHLYLKHGFRLASERRYIFEIPRTGPPAARAIAALPWHALAEVFGAIGARGVAGRPWRAKSGPTQGPEPVPFVFREHGVATLTAENAESIHATVRDVFRSTLARSVRVSVPFAANVRGGRLIAMLQRMEKVLS